MRDHGVIATSLRPVSAIGLEFVATSSEDALLFGENSLRVDELIHLTWREFPPIPVATEHGNRGDSHDSQDASPHLPLAHGKWVLFVH